MLTESTKKLREPIALALLAATALYLITVLALFFKEGLDFADKAFYLNDELTNPVWVLVVIAAVVLVARSDQPSAKARTITMVALGLLGAMLVLGLLTLLIGYGADTDFAEVGKLAGTFLTLARLLVVAAAAAFAYAVFKALPAPARRPKAQQQWAQQPGQQSQWGQQGQPNQYGQPGLGQQGQWAAPAAGGAVAGGAAAGGPAWGQQDPGQQSPSYGGGAQASGWGQPQDPYAAQPPHSTGGDQHGAYAPQPAPEQRSGGDQPSWGQPPQEPRAAWGQPPQEPQAGWGQPPQEQAAWDRTSHSELDPEATMVHDAQRAPEDETGAPQPVAEDQPAHEDDQRPGWWAPGS